jgi:hypothetical protein
VVRWPQFLLIPDVSTKLLESELVVGSAPRGKAVRRARGFRIIGAACSAFGCIKLHPGAISKTAFLHFELQNCGANYPTVPSNPAVVVQTAFDLIELAVDLLRRMTRTSASGSKLLASLSQSRDLRFRFRIRPRRHLFRVPGEFGTLQLVS